MNKSVDPIQCNSDGLEYFAQGNPSKADKLLKRAYSNLPEETGILVNLGLALWQQGHVKQAERAYRLALGSSEQRVQRSAAKNLGFLMLWQGKYDEGWKFHGLRFKGESFEANQWRGDPLNGKTLTIWNDVGMGDAFHFVRYTLPFIERGEKVRFAVDRSQVTIFREYLAWQLTEVVDREKICLDQEDQHIPLMSLIGLLDKDTMWGRSFKNPTWKIPDNARNTGQKIGICWASNPQDKTMHIYKSSTPHQVLAIKKKLYPECNIVSLQTNEDEAHIKLELSPAKMDWTTTLKTIAGCKAIISVDTAVAHLAAGIGRPVHLLLRKPSDWRWRQVPGDQNKRLWYQNVMTTELQELITR